MIIFLRAALMLVDPRGGTPVGDPELADLDSDETDFLSSHVRALQDRLTDAESQRSRFRSDSNMEQVLKKLIAANEEGFLNTARALARRLEATMKGATNPNVGVLAVLLFHEDDSSSRSVAILKLDANKEGALFERIGKTGLKLRILRDLLPSAGELQKAMLWPDNREGSDAVIKDRNLKAAYYFLNAYDLEVATKPNDTENVLLKRLSSLPPDRILPALSRASQMSGPADVVAATLKEEFPELDISDRAFGLDGAVPGIVRPRSLAEKGVFLRADGVEIRLSPGMEDRVEIRQVGDQWQIIIVTNTRPRWASQHS
jgi:hypothetical protein